MLVVSGSVVISVVHGHLKERRSSAWAAATVGGGRETEHFTVIALGFFASKLAFGLGAESGSAALPGALRKK